MDLEGRLFEAERTIDDLQSQLFMCKKANAEAQETVKALLRDKLVLQEQLLRERQ
jgi:hypothetical protein